MSTPETREHALPFQVPPGHDQEMQELIASWRYAGTPTSWDAIVGHSAQVQRCRELVEKLRRRPEELARLRIRAGAGLVISGPAGVGKSLLARALASALERDVIVPPTSELSAETIRRLYAELAKNERPVVVLLDEAEVLIGVGWMPGLDPAAVRSLLAALDGIERPDLGPITVALTTADLDQLDGAAIRPGRLAPRLVLEGPTAEDRRLLLERASAGLPIAGELDLGTVVERTAGWSGAELVVAIEEACSRSLVDGSDALRQDLLLEVVAERYVVRDEQEQDEQSSLRLAIHEAGHVLFGFLNFPGGVVSVQLRGDSGRTSLEESIERAVHDEAGLQRLAQMAMAGDAAEGICFGAHGRSPGSENDKRRATALLWAAVQARKPYAPSVLEEGEQSDHGSERMRAGWHAEVEQLAADTFAAVLRWLTPHHAGLLRFARLLLDAEDQSLSGEGLEEAIEAAMPGAVSNLYGEVGA